MKNYRFLTANAIKIIAVIAMLLDQICAFFFEHLFWVRCLCRISFPLFAYFIAEGCKYTKNKPKRFIFMFVLGVIFQVVFSGVSYGFKALGDLNILLTFSLSVLVIYILQAIKSNYKKSTKKCVGYLVLLILFIVAIAIFTHYFYLEYSFWGVILPALVSLFDLQNTNFSDKTKRYLDNEFVKMIMFVVGVSLLALNAPYFGWYQLFGLLSIFVLIFYNGQKGKLNLKYLFYIFYPTHFAILYVISIFI